MKEIDLSGKGPQQRRLAEQEVKVLSNLKHPYIVRYWESFSQGDCLCIIMDYCEGGDLLQYISTCRRRNGSIPEPYVLRWFTQMALALKYMHGMKVLHRDLKSQNMFLASRESGTGSLPIVKIADFGISKVLGEGHQAFARTLVGTPYYLSPEICNKEPYATPSDIWSFGCVLYELCALHVPFEAHDLNELVHKIVTGATPRIPNTYSRELSDIAAALLQRNAHRRPSASEILHKPFIQAEMKRMLAENEREHGGPRDRENSGERKGGGRTPSSRVDRRDGTPSSRAAANSKPCTPRERDGSRNRHAERRHSEPCERTERHSEEAPRERRPSRPPSAGSRCRENSAEPAAHPQRRPLQDHNGRERSKTPRAYKPPSLMPSPPLSAAMEVLRPCRGASPSHGSRHR